MKYKLLGWLLLLAGLAQAQTSITFTGDTLLQNRPLNRWSVAFPGGKPYYMPPRSQGGYAKPFSLGAAGNGATFASVISTSLAAGQAPTATLTGPSTSLTLAIGIPAGLPGAPGQTPFFAQVNSFSLAAGIDPSATITGPINSMTLTFGIPAGPKGDKGDTGNTGLTGATGTNGVSPVIASIVSTSLPAGSQPTAQLTGPQTSLTLTLGIPKGDTGNSGSGSGDMSRSTYDQNSNNTVDNSEKLGGNAPSFYQDYNNITVNKPTIPAATTIVNNLTTSSTGFALDANAGKTLKGLVDGNTDAINLRVTTAQFGNYTTTQGQLDQTQSTSIAANNTGLSSLSATVNTGRLAGTQGTNTGDQQLLLNGNQLSITGPNGTTVTLPNSATGTGGSYVLSSASPYTPISTSGTSYTINSILNDVLGTPVLGFTQAAIANAISSVPTGVTPRLQLLTGVYSFSAAANSPIVVSRNLELLGSRGGGTVFDGGTVNGYFFKFNNFTSLLVQDISFRSNSTAGTDYGMIYINAEGSGARNLVFRRVRAKAPKGNYNFMSSDAFDGTSAVFHTNWLFDDCHVDSVGRMGYELKAHKHDGVPRLIGLRFVNCSVKNAGLNNPPNTDNVPGFAWSISGDATKVDFVNPVVENALIGLELVGTRNFTVDNPHITSYMSTTAANGTVLGATGISITDGYQEESMGNPGKRPNNGNIVGGEILVSGQAMHTYYADSISFNGVKTRGGQYSAFQHGAGLNLYNSDFVVTGEKYIVSFEDQKQINVHGGLYSRQFAPRNNPRTNGQWPMYEPIAFSAGSNGYISGVDVRTNTAINGGNPDNINDDFTKGYVYSDNNQVSWSNIRFNGVKMPDRNRELIPTLTITAAGSYTLANHISRVNINPTTAISSLTLTLATGVQDGAQVKINFGGTITNGNAVVNGLTINGPAGKTPIQSNTPTSGSSGQMFVYVWDSLRLNHQREN